MTMNSFMKNLSPKVALALVSFFLGQLGDGLNIFQVSCEDRHWSSPRTTCHGSSSESINRLSLSLSLSLSLLSFEGIYLVALGWNEGSVGVALGAMGFTALLVQTFAGDVIDKTHLDRRTFLTLSASATAFSASAILFVHEGNTDHALVYGTKVVEGASSSFIGPCVAALTLATFGPDAFDDAMASNILWGHVGSVASAVLAGIVGYVMYPDIKYCFLVIGFSAVMAVFGVQLLPEGDPLMGRGLRTHRRHHAGNNATGGRAEDDDAPEAPVAGNGMRNDDSSSDYVDMKQQDDGEQMASSYWSVFSDRKTVVLCLTGFFFQ